MARRRLHHHLNALHIMAVLLRTGLPLPVALRIARGWERLVHPLLYRWVRAPTLGPAAACEPSLMEMTSAPSRVADQQRTEATQEPRQTR